MTRQLPMRQRIRTALITISFLLFPLTMYYFSPYVIIDGAMNGISHGSLVVFGLMFSGFPFSGPPVVRVGLPGRGVAGIPGAGQQTPGAGTLGDWIKWLIWAPWILVIAAMFVSAGGPRRVDILYMTTGRRIGGRTVSAYFVFYVVIGLFVVLSLTVGRRAGCHTICWMAPFMILGRKAAQRTRPARPGLGGGQLTPAWTAASAPPTAP